MTVYRLTFFQSVQSALGVLAMYFPITLFVNLPAYTLSFLRAEAPFLLMLGLINGLIFLGWILLNEHGLDWVTANLGDKFFTDYRVAVQLLVLFGSCLAGILLANLSELLFEMAQRTPTFVNQVTVPKQVNGITLPLIDPGAYHRRANIGLNIVILFSIFYIAANRRVVQRLRDNQIQTERLGKETVLAQFAALKSQVSPHFLFNSLSILSSLVHVDPDLSEQFIDKLSRAYRYILEQKDNDRIDLRTELTFLESYTFLLKIRFESGFDVRVDADVDLTKRYQIAPLTLQLLIENAVKHNRMSPEEPLTVYIEQEADCLVVSNDLRPREQLGPSTGVGLQNIINRYRLLTDRAVWVGQEQGRFVVKIPLLTHPFTIIP
ncbi:sensor histidine kinase [Spirosoma soli]|uniref:Sensor histidine kinase n=1 Tax=Spirosoma soli TaxID=1770529 RepID=A0ABW5M2Q7_9BACT